MASERPPCRYFQVGQCTAGDRCRFSHVVGGPSVRLSAPCKFWLAGHCAHGERCPFAHPPRERAAPPRAAGAPPASRADGGGPSGAVECQPATKPAVRAGCSYAAAAVGADGVGAPGVGAASIAAAVSAAERPSLFTPTEAEVAASAVLDCAICLEAVAPQGRRFGILTGCDHVVCMGCIAQWRSTHAIRPQVARTCPECRTLSHFVVPSAVHVAEPTRKALLIHAHVTELSRIPCKHFAHGAGTCPFGTSCFYAHTDIHGRPIAAGPRRAVDASGASRVLKTYTLSDHLFGNAEEEEAEAARRMLEAIPISEPPAAAGGDGAGAATGSRSSAGPRDILRR